MFNKDISLLKEFTFELANEFFKNRGALASNQSKGKLNSIKT